MGTLSMTGLRNIRRATCVPLELPQELEWIPEEVLSPRLSSYPLATTFRTRVIADCTQQLRQLKRFLQKTKT